MRRRLLVGLGPLPGLEVTFTYGGGVTGPAAYWVTDVAWTVAALRARLESFNGVWFAAVDGLSVRVVFFQSRLKGPRSVIAG
ncbi:MAG: hypothetical protein M3495_22035 [Pseudomonadota bacterium]|nr:hypothetical protein [Gammaproteobacteria bacterium]MDQ3584105.1 hypothetical protein [Pseudomonadota bacterium]